MPRRATSPLRLVSSQPASAVVPASPQPACDDVALVAEVRLGEPKATFALYDRARPLVDRAIYRLLGRHDSEHEDLVQLSMIQLVASIKSYRGDCSLDTWISRVTAFTVMKELPRRKTRRRLFSDAEIEAEGTPSCENVERAVLSRGVIARVRDHLDAMDPEKAWTVLLHDVCGYVLSEIAEITEVSIAAAQTRLSRGRRELHERIAADPELADELRARGPS